MLESRSRLALSLLCLVAISLTSCSTIGELEIEEGKVRIADLASPPVESPGWSGWRGPARDGRIFGVKAPSTPPEEWKELWRVTVGEGFSGVVCDGDRVYTHARVEDEEVVSCHDVRTGKIVWSRSNAIEPWGQPFAAMSITDGPLATPTVAREKLYTVGIHGFVQCFDAASGEVLFRVSAEDLAGSPSEYHYGHSSSPLVKDGRLFVCFSAEDQGHLVALDAGTGKLLWRAIPEGVTYVSPVHAEIHGRKQVVVRSWERILGLDPASGKILWSHGAKAGGVIRQDCTTPMVVGDVVYFTNHFHGTIAVRIAREGDTWSAERAYRTGALSGRMASPVYHDMHLYGLHKRGRFACIDARTGERKWVARDFDQYLSLIQIGDRVLALDNEGKLALIQLSPEGYRPLAERAVGEYTWAHPALDGKRFYFRDGDDVVCLEFPIPPG